MFRPAVASLVVMGTEPSPHLEISTRLYQVLKQLQEQVSKQPSLQDTIGMDLQQGLHAAINHCSKARPYRFQRSHIVALIWVSVATVASIVFLFTVDFLSAESSFFSGAVALGSALWFLRHTMAQDRKKTSAALSGFIRELQGYPMEANFSDTDLIIGAKRLFVKQLQSQMISGPSTLGLETQDEEHATSSQEETSAAAGSIETKSEDLSITQSQQRDEAVDPGRALQALASSSPMFQEISQILSSQAGEVRVNLPSDLLPSLERLTMHLRQYGDNDKATEIEEKIQLIQSRVVAK